MRRVATAERIRTFLRRLGEAYGGTTTVYLTGGSTAVLLGWRDATIDIDLKLVPEDDAILRAIVGLKEELEINVELASPDQFIPVPSGWESRSPWEQTERGLTIRHFDLAAQALAKLERGHERDLGDVAAMVERGLVEPERLWAQYEEIEPQLFRFPAIDAPSFRRALERFLGQRPTAPDDQK